MLGNETERRGNMDEHSCEGGGMNEETEGGGVESTAPEGRELCACPSLSACLSLTVFCLQVDSVSKTTGSLWTCEIHLARPLSPHPGEALGQSRADEPRTKLCSILVSFFFSAHLLEGGCVPTQPRKHWIEVASEMGATGLLKRTGVREQARLS
eukprot:2466917-Rhodomonas_salina.2